MNYAKILTFDCHTPEVIVSNDELTAFVDTSDEWIYSRTGTKRRHISTKENENTSSLCTAVAEKLMAKTGVVASDIDLIIVGTVSPDNMFPSTACVVQKNIGAVNAFGFDVSAACSGFVYGLSVAEKMIMAGSVQTALVIGCEVLSKLTDWSDRATCVLFGDGAGGAILTRSDTRTILSEDLRSDGTRRDSLYGADIPLRNPFMKESDETEHNKYIIMNGREVFDFAIREVPKSIIRVLEKAGLTFDDVDFFVLHQANARIIQGIAKKLKLPITNFFMNTENYANTSSASIGIALTEMLEKGIISMGSGQKVVISGYGGGLTWATMLLQL